MPKIPKVILLIESSRAYGRGLLRGIAKYANLHGPWAFYCEPGGQERPLPQLNNWNVNGVIARLSGTEKDKEIMAKGLPFVVIAFKNQIPGLPNIIADNVAVGKMAAEHLLNCGFDQFAFCGFARVDWSLERKESFSKAIAEAGFKTYVYERPRAKLKFSWENEYVLMAKWLKSLPKPVALMACNDDHSRHVIEACKIAGLHVPEQVAIVGVDNDDLICELSDPPLSSVALNTERAGYEAAELLDKLMASKKMAKKRIIVRPTRIVIRQSTYILAIDDRDVAEAMRFIHQHSKEPIQVGDVTAAVGLSRSPLQKRFCKILRRSIHEEIRRVRVDQVARMLLETNMSVSQIALASGYLSEKHIARPFRREKGVSPLAYRKQYGSK